MERIVDISSEGLCLGIYRGFLTVQKDGDCVGRVALDDIGGLIAHAHGLTWSNNVFVRLAERDIPVVICAPNHAPVTCLWPLEGHHRQGARMRAQAGARLPLRKQAWRKIVSAKIRMQAAVLQSVGAEAGAFERLARSVRSGDPNNLEAQAARRYWPLLMGSEFRRDQASGGANGLLNYGYTVLRAILSRAICASGLHPTLGVHHANQGIRTIFASVRAGSSLMRMPGGSKPISRSAAMCSYFSSPTGSTKISCAFPTKAGENGRKIPHNWRCSKARIHFDAACADQNTFEISVLIQQAA